jgi:aldehyde:ferredoxin oxidoreductase
LLKAGERIWNLQKEINVREGASMEDDLPSYRMMNESVAIGSKIHPPVNEDTIKSLLHEYYEECGWGSDGRPKKEKLIELGITNS